MNSKQKSFAINNLHVIGNEIYVILNALKHKLWSLFHENPERNSIAHFMSYNSWSIPYPDVDLFGVEIKYLTHRELKYGEEKSKGIGQHLQTGSSPPTNSISIVKLVTQLQATLPRSAPSATDIHALANPDVGPARISRSLAE